MVDFVQPIRISSLLSGYLDGDVTSRHQLEDFLVSDNFWSDIFLECSEHTSFLCDCSLSKLCLMLFSRRLRVYGCDESIGRALIDLLLPLSNLEGTRGPLAAVLADVVVRSPLEAALVVKHVLDWSCEDTFFCLLFLDEVAASAGRLASLPRDHSDEKREALISLHEGVLRFCLQVVSAPQLPEETRVGGVDCFTRWLTTDCLPPRALEARIFHPPPPPPPAPPPAAAAACWLSPVAAEDSSISDCSLVSAPEVLLLSCLTSPAACAALLSAAADLLEALFARCWEGRSCPEASRSSMPPEMRLSAGAADHLAISTARAVVGTGTVHMFRQSVLSSPDHCFGTVFLPDRYCFGTACGPELNTGNCTASVPLSPEAMRALTRVLGVTVKALVESSSNPFRVPRHAASDVDESVESGVDLDDDVSGDSESDSDYDGDDDSFDDEDTDSTEHNMSPTSLLAMELLAGLVTAAALREVSVALIALEACVFAHYRMTPAESLRGFYRLLLQAALRQCCVSYGRGHQDAMPSPLSVSMCCDAEWKLAREEVLSEVVRIVYLMLREEFLVFSSEILDQSLSLVLAFPGNEEVLGSISVVSGVIFALQTCSADLTRRSLLAATPSACSPELLADSTNTTQYLLRFLSTIFSHSFSAPSSAPLSRVFAHPEVANAMLCLIGSLSSWVSQASCGLDSRVTGALEGGVSDEGVGQCLQVSAVCMCCLLTLTLTHTFTHTLSLTHSMHSPQYLAAGYSCPATMLVASRALSEFCGHNSRSILHQRTVVAKEGWHFPLLDAIIEHCWSASVALTALGDEGLDQLGEGLELDPACCSEEGQDGAAVRAAIQRNTLRALCLVLGQIPPDSSDISSDGSTLSPSASRKRYQDCLLQALLSTLELVLSPPPQAEPCDTTTEIVVALQLLAAMVSSRVAVVSVIGLLTGKGERLGLLQPQEPPLSSKVSDSLCKLCTCVLRAAPECLPPRNCLDLAEELFLHHACHSRLCWGYVAAALEELGARGCHLQRMKQKIGSTFGEVSVVLWGCGCAGMLAWLCSYSVMSISASPCPSFSPSALQ